MFGEESLFGGKDKHKIFDERNLEDLFVKKSRDKRQICLGGILAVYRNLRENSEYHLRYHEASKFFTREMELRRNYREASFMPSILRKKLVQTILSSLKLYQYVETSSHSFIIRNNWWRRNLFSLVGIYHWLSDYGGSLLYPFLIFAVCR